MRFLKRLSIKQDYCLFKGDTPSQFKSMLDFVSINKDITKRVHLYQITLILYQMNKKKLPKDD